MIDDVRDALAVLRPMFDDSNGCEGCVSLQVAPDLAHDTEGTIRAVRDLHTLIDQPNLFVKIPATAAGVATIRAMTAEGCSINVTLIFSLSRYQEVIDAYIAGLEDHARADGDLADVHSVASFFVSRVETEVDRRLDAIGTPEALAVRGRAAVAQAKVAHQLFLERFGNERWSELADAGAHRQRPLWASTSTKNPAYADTLYVDNLIGAHTVNTLPENTIVAFEDHWGKPDRRWLGECEPHGLVGCDHEDRAHRRGGDRLRMHHPVEVDHRETGGDLSGKAPSRGRGHL